MPWFRMDIHWYQDPAIEVAAEEAGPLVLALFPVFLAKAKAQANGGEVEFTFRDLSHQMFAGREEISKAIEALVSARVLSCPQLSALSGVVAFDPDTWRKWNEAARKAGKREEQQTA